MTEHKVAEIAYAAGLIDGEGCFFIGKGINGNTAIYLQVKMTDRAAVQWLHETFGGVFGEKAASTNRAENTFEWRVFRRDLLYRVTKELLPYLKVKRLAATITVDFCEKFKIRPGVRLSEEEKTEMEKYREFMSVANGRGPGSAERKENFLALIKGNCT